MYTFDWMVIIFVYLSVLYSLNTQLKYAYVLPANINLVDQTKDGHLVARWLCKVSKICFIRRQSKRRSTF
jgi:hypothetical protein